jgi:hypothetical protein
MAAQSGLHMGHGISSGGSGFCNQFPFNPEFFSKTGANINFKNPRILSSVTYYP